MSSITRGQIRQLAEIHRNRRGGMQREFALFCANHGVEVREGDDPMQMLEPLLAADNAGEGLGKQVQGLINLLTSGGLLSFGNIEFVQAKILWDLCFGQVLGLATFEQYLRGTDAVQGVMDVPVWPSGMPDYLNHNVLVDGRIPEQVGLKELCRLCGILYNGEDDTFVPYDPSVAKNGLRWMRGHDGRRNRNVAPNKCRTTRFVQGEVGQDAVEGVSLYVQDDSVLKGHVMDLPGSFPAGCHGGCAYLVHWRGRPLLSWYGGDRSDPVYGSASRWSV